MLTNQNFKIGAGDVAALRFKLTLGAGVPNLSGAKVEWRASKTNPPPQSGAAITKNDASGALVESVNGVWFAVVPIAKADTQALAGDYYHECRVYLPDGSVDKIVAVGTMNVARTVAAYETTP